MPLIDAAIETGMKLAPEIPPEWFSTIAKIWEPVTRTTESLLSPEQTAKIAEHAANPTRIADAPGTTKLGPGDYVIEFPGSDRRAYQLHVPPSYRPSDRLPIVFAADGLQLGKTENSMPIFNSFNEAADRHNFIAAYPIAETSPKSPVVRGWNLGQHGILKFDGQPKDVGYFRDVRNDILNRTGGDPSRLYGVGHSAGGQYINYLAATEPTGTFKGIGIVNGTTLIGQALPKPGISAVIIHGTKDPLLPYEGGAGAALPRFTRLVGPNNVELSAPARQFTNFVEANGISIAPIKENTDLFELRFTGLPKNTSVSEYRVNYAGHLWPGSSAPNLKIFGDVMPRERFDATKTYLHELGITGRTET